MFDLLKLFKIRDPRAEPFPPEWEEVLRRNVLHSARLSESSREKLRSDVQVLISNRDWEACGGLRLTDEIRVTIAAQACLLTLGFEGEPYPNVSTILVYPTGYLAPEKVY